MFQVGRVCRLTSTTDADLLKKTKVAALMVDLGGGSKIGKFLKQKNPKSTLLADNTRVDNNKTNKAQIASGPYVRKFDIVLTSSPVKMPLAFSPLGLMHLKCQRTALSQVSHAWVLWGPIPDVVRRASHEFLDERVDLADKLRPGSLGTLVLLLHVFGE